MSGGLVSTEILVVSMRICYTNAIVGTVPLYPLFHI